MTALRLGTQHPHFHYSSGVGDIRLDIVGAVQLKELTVFITVVEPLSGSDGHPHPLLDFPQSLFIIRGNRFFKPENIIILEPFTDFDSGRNIKAAVSLYEQLNIISDSFCNLFGAQTEQGRLPLLFLFQEESQGKG
jgi:hypothetical protein